MGENKNFILFAIISLVILLGYQYFFVGPQIEETKRQQAIQETLKKETESLTPMEAPNAVVETPAAQAPQLEDAGNVAIDTPELIGSLSLRGARFDDLSLVNHMTSMEDDAENVRLLASPDNPFGYFVRFGWTVQGKEKGFMPDGSSIWTADKDKLTPGAPVTLAWDNGQGVRYLMKVAVDKQFMFTVTQSVINATGETLNIAPYGMITRKGEPKTAGLYILHEGPLGVFNGKLEERKYKDLQDDDNFETSTTGGWMGITDKFWMTTLIPDQNAEISRARMERIETSGTPIYRVNYVQNWQSVEAGATSETTNMLYSGAKIVGAIDNYEAKYGITLFDRTIDWGWFYWLTRPIFKCLHFLFQWTGNFGVSILLLTVVVKLIMFPLANKSYVSMSHMKKAQPKLKKLQERYKDDKQRLQQEMMALYKKEKINPMAGCLPMLVQIPVFFALYKVLYVTIEMRHQPFVGWITDLSAADHMTPLNLFGLIPWNPPAVIAIGILPILMGLSMWLQQKMNPQTSMDPTQQKIMSFLPLIFTFVMARFSAGLVLYWTWNNLLSIAQQWVIMRREEARNS